MLTMGQLEMLIYLPFCWLWIGSYILSSQKKKIQMDLDRFYSVHYKTKPKNYIIALHNEFVCFKEFRSIFYARIGKWRKLWSWIAPGQTLLSFDVPREKIGGGIFIQHGYCTDLSCRAIGDNCWINQKVTVAYRGNDCPTIGNNVRIGTGAIIIGGIHIGDNAKIAAGAIVVKDVPANCVVACQYAQMVKNNS